MTRDQNGELPIAPETVQPAIKYEAPPIVDIGALMGSGDDAAAEVAAKAIDDASRHLGFFYVTNHGVTQEEINAVIEASRQFYKLPVENKQKVRACAGEGAGWEPSGAQVLDEGRLGEGIDGEKKAMGDLKESYIFGRATPKQTPPEGSTIEDGILACWPSSDTISDEVFKTPLKNYHDKCINVCSGILRGVARALGRKPDFFDKKMDDPPTFTKLRILHYPAVSSGVYARGQPGAGAHCDWGLLSLLIQDDVGGLEVCRPDGEWIKALGAPGAILCNVGDLLQRWTVDAYRSAPHRVLKPMREDASRYSAAFFHNGNHDTLVDPRDLVDAPADGDTLKFEKPITSEEYILMRVAATYADGNAGYKGA